MAALSYGDMNRGNIHGILMIFHVVTMVSPLDISVPMKATGTPQGTIPC